MSYRNDHDAAIARVDALTHQLDRTCAERDHLQAEVERLRGLPPRPPPVRARATGFAIFAALAAFFGVVLPHKHHHPTPPAYAPATMPQVPAAPTQTTTATTTTTTTKPVPAASPTPAAPRARDPDRSGAQISFHGALYAVLRCVEQTQRARADIALQTDLRPLRATCRADVESLIRQRSTGGKVSELLTQWLALEDRLSPALAAYNTYVLRDPDGVHYRAPGELRDEFYTALGARDSVLTAIHDALQALELEPAR